MYFSVTLNLAGEDISGINALDTCRRLQLGRDTNSLSFSSHGTQGSRTCRISVTESFARAWFNPEETEQEIAVPKHFLVAGDVRFCNDNNDYSLTFSETITDARVQELYIAVRFAELRQQVSQLTKQRDELKRELSELQG